MAALRGCVLVVVRGLHFGVAEVAPISDNVYEVWQEQQREINQAGAGELSQHVRNLMPHFILRTGQPPQANSFHHDYIKAASPAPPPQNLSNPHTPNEILVSYAAPQTTLGSPSAAFDSPSMGFLAGFVTLVIAGISQTCLSSVVRSAIVSKSANQPSENPKEGRG